MTGRQTGTRALVALALACTAAPPATAAIIYGDMSGYSGGGGQGCLAESELAGVAAFLADTGRAIDLARPEIEARARGTYGGPTPSEEDDVTAKCAQVLRHIGDYERFRSAYQNLFPPWLATTKDPLALIRHGHRFVRNDLVAEDLSRSEPWLARLAANIFRRGQFDGCAADAAGKASELATLLARIGDSGFLSDNESEELKLVAILRGVNRGYALSMPFEPFVPAKGTTSFALSYDYMPGNRAAGTKLQGDERYRAAELALRFDWSLSDSLAIGATVPFIVQNDTPATDREQLRGTGVGAVSLRLRWWLTESWQRRGGASFTPFWDGLEVGTGLDLSLPAGAKAEREGRGNDSAYLRFDFLKLSYELKSNVAFDSPVQWLYPRFHLFASKRFDLGDDTAAPPSRDPGGWDLIIGALWNEDGWRTTRTDNGNFAGWVDFHGEYLDDEIQSVDSNPATLESRWSLRAGFAYGHTYSGNSAPWRLSLGGEIGHQLTDRGIYSNVTTQMFLRIEH